MDDNILPTARDAAPQPAVYSTTESKTKSDEEIPARNSRPAAEVVPTSDKDEEELKLVGYIPPLVHFLVHSQSSSLANGV